MIDYIKGVLTELTPAVAVVEAAGVGYELNISLSTYDSLKKCGGAQQYLAPQEPQKVYVYEDIREDAWVLFGFATREERELFLLLISVSGVGGNTARTILSAYPVGELASIITNRQDGMLRRVKGIGGKTAQRIIVEIEDRVQKLGIGNEELEMRNSQSSNSKFQSPITPAGEEALAALQMLGFSPAPSRKVVRTLIEKDASLTAEQIIKQALKMI